MQLSQLFQKTTICFLLLILCSSLSSAGELTPVGGTIELAVPSDGQSLFYTHEKNHDVAVAADGTFVVTWIFKLDKGLSQFRQSDTDYPFPIYARRFNANGIPLTDIIEVNTVQPILHGDERIKYYNPRVATDAMGNFVICWTKNIKTQAGNVVQFYFRLFYANGIPRSDEIIIDNEISYLSSAWSFWSDMATAMNPAGNFAITWNGDERDQYTNGDPDQPIYIQIFDKDGNARNILPERVNPHVVNPENCQLISRPSVAMNAEGGAAVVWSVLRTIPMYPVPSTVRYMIQHFNPDGSRAGLHKTLVKSKSNDYSILPNNRFYISDAAPVIAMSNSGDYALNFFRFMEYPVYRFYNNSDVAKGLEHPMNVYVNINREYTDAAMDDNGNLTIGWLGCNSRINCIENDEAIYLMQVSSRRPALKSLVRVVENVPYDVVVGASFDISYPAIDTSDDGRRIVVVWHDNEKILGRIYRTE